MVTLDAGRLADPRVTLEAPSGLNGRVRCPPDTGLPKGAQMTKLKRLFSEHGQSPWLDNLSRGYLRGGTLARYIPGGVRGVTANPTIFARAIEGSAAYDEQFSTLIAAGWSVADAYWELVIDDIGSTLEEHGVASFHDSFAHVLAALETKTGQLAQG